MKWSIGMEWKDRIVVRIGAMRDAKQEHREDEGMLIIILYEYVYYHMLSSHTIIAVQCSSAQQMQLSIHAAQQLIIIFVSQHGKAQITYLHY